MTNTVTIDQIQYLFTFPFKDADWKRKFLIGFLLYMAGFIIPIVPWIFVSGYISKMIAIGISSDDFYLPEWDNWGDLFSKGLRLMALGFIASLPLIVLFACGYLSMMAPVFATEFATPSYGDEYSSAWLLTPMLGMFGGMCLMGMSTIFGLLIGILFPPAIGYMIAEDQFSAAFRVKEWWRIFRVNIGGYLIAYVLLMGTTFLMTFAFQLLYMTIVLCCTIPFVTGLISIYIGIVMGAMFGQAYRVGKENTELDLLPDEIAP